MIYNFFSFLLYIIIFITSIFNKKIKVFFAKRVCSVKPIEKGNYILIHASSLGEINLLDPFIKKILLDETKNIIISVVTDTGYNQALNKYSSSKVKVVYFPLDVNFLIKKIFKNVNIQKTIIVETEIWPNLINYAYKNSQLFLLNGRISDKSFKSYFRLKFYLKPILNKFKYLIMQTEDDKDRIIKLGARTDKVYNFGNLKFDINFDDYSEKELSEFKEFLGLSKKVFVAGSTRDGEEEIIIEVFKKLKDYQLILVPRHIERIDSITKLLNGDNYSLYSNLKKNSNIIIVDKVGILRKLYAIADITFVGGTLVNIGGHSLLEPLYYGKKPIFGPYLQNVKDIANEILRLDLGYKVEGIEEFIRVIDENTSSPDDFKRIKDFLDRNSKSSKKSYKLIFEE